MARARTGGNSSAAWAITALAAGFGVCLVLAIVLFAQSGGAQEERDGARRDLDAFVNAGERELPAVAEARSTATAAGGSVVGVLLQRITESEQAAAVAGDRLAEAQNQVSSLEGRLEDAQARVEQAEVQAQAASAERDSLRATYNEQAAALKSDVGKAASLNEKLQGDLAEMRTSLTGTMGEARGDLQGRIDQLQIELAASGRELDDAVEALNRATARRAERAARVATPDARIVSILDNGSGAYLNIGANQRVSLGMTFGVFNPSTLVKLGDAGGDTEQVPPKAVMEVYELAPGTATARVVERQPGARIAAGDPVVNIAFDPERQLKFFTFGDFDVDGDDEATAPEAERIRSMIRRYGAELTDDLDFDVDYLVLGAPPVLPRELVGSELTNPVRIKEYNAALEEFNTLTGLLTQAERYTIPVLNQNRFLDLIGYYTR